MGLVGLSAVTAGSSALNQVLERATDRLMARTSSRPLPQNRIRLAHGLILGLHCVAGGLVFLVCSTNLLSAALALVAAAGYVAIYTPLKRVTRLNTVVGGLFGALPPLIGWTAARGAIEWPDVALFAIQFIWQLPQVIAIGWLNREDYIRAGIRVPATCNDQKSSARSSAIWALFFTAIMMPISLWPVRLHIAGVTYLIAGTVLGAWYFVAALKFARITRAPDERESRKLALNLLRASVIYLPLLLLTLTLSAKLG